MRKSIAAMAACALLAACSNETTEPSAVADEAAAEPDPVTLNEQDPYLWLEEVEGEEALAWVEEQNELSLGYLEALPQFEPLYQRNLEIYNSDDRIPMPGLRGDAVYNYWKDADHVRGLWRRMPLQDYLAGSAEWEILLDLDALAEAEGEDWVWKGPSCLRPDYRRCLLNLSRGGADATVVREFDTVTGEFVEDGFYLPEAKSQLSWVDENTIFVGTDYGDGSLTESGYPRTSRLWRRGESLEQAPEVFGGEVTDVSAGAYRTWDGDTPYDFAYRTPDFFTQQSFLLVDGEPRRVEIPDDAVFRGILKGQLLFTLRGAWAVDGITYPQGVLLSIDFAKFMDSARDFQVVFAPTDTTFLARGGVASTRDYLVLNLLDDVVSRLMRFELVDGRWVGEVLETPDNGAIALVAAADGSNDLFYTYEGFLNPDTLYHSADGGRGAVAMKSLP